MIVNGEDVEFCLRKAYEIRTLRKLYFLGHDTIKRSVDDLYDLCVEQLNRPVTIHELNMDAGENEIRGLFMAKADGTYDIYLLGDLSPNEHRFVRCKELFHVVLDQDECHNMKLFEHIEDTNQSLQVVSHEPDEEAAKTPVASELLAEVAAMEYMFPYKERVIFLQTAGEYPDTAALAKRYGIPIAHVERYLTKGMMEQLRDVHVILDEENGIH